jgi:hypothetical protein
MALFESQIPVISPFYDREHLLSPRPIEGLTSGLVVFPTATTSGDSPLLGVGVTVVRPRNCESRRRCDQRGPQRFRIQIGEHDRRQRLSWLLLRTSRNSYELAA